ncbi:MAG: hypothetical protein GY823_01685 [Flavobacteriaceae bacterium]|nr:hypothetical protein [Flavobacteriaceae bacterium]
MKAVVLDPSCSGSGMLNNVENFYSNDLNLTDTQEFLKHIKNSYKNLND